MLVSLGSLMVASLDNVGVVMRQDSQGRSYQYCFGGKEGINWWVNEELEKGQDRLRIAVLRQSLLGSCSNPSLYLSAHAVSPPCSVCDRF